MHRGKTSVFCRRDEKNPYIFRLRSASPMKRPSTVHWLYPVARFARFFRTGVTGNLYAAGIRS